MQGPAVVRRRRCVPRGGRLPGSDIRTGRGRLGTAVRRRGGRPDLDAGCGREVPAAVRYRRRRPPELLPRTGAAPRTGLSPGPAQARRHSHRGRRLPHALPRRGRGRQRRRPRWRRPELPDHRPGAGTARHRAEVCAAGGRSVLSGGRGGQPDASRRHRRQPAAELLARAGAAPGAGVRRRDARAERHPGRGRRLRHDLSGGGRRPRTRRRRRRRAALQHHRGGGAGRRIRRRLRRRGRRRSGVHDRHGGAAAGPLQLRPRPARGDG